MKISTGRLITTGKNQLALESYFQLLLQLFLCRDLFELLEFVSDFLISKDFFDNSLNKLYYFFSNLISLIMIFVSIKQLLYLKTIHLKKLKKL